MDAELFDDDPGCLPGKFQPLYINPYKIFGINEMDIPNEKELIKVVRDKVRRAALGQCKYFWGLPQNKAPLEEILFAYFLIRRTLVGPAQRIKAALQSHGYLDFRPEDLLPTLRPLQGVIETPSEYRAFRNLNIAFSHAVLEMNMLVVPVYAFVLNIHYCMRKHSIQRTYADMQQFHLELREELLTVPQFPEDAGSFSFLTDLSQALSWSAGKHRGKFPSRDEVGHKLAAFLQRVHNSLAESGRFSPRLLRFLDVDFERVQSEEEGAILQIIDSQILPPRSCWYMVDESWLGKWRRFAMGRGPRRYLPPGPISNLQLAFDMNTDYENRRDARDTTNFDQYSKNGKGEEAKKGQVKIPQSSASKKWLEKVKHYRCVNCNVWKFYQLVHGGGPVISRQDADIYSPFSVSYLQGVEMLQTRVRIMIAKRKREELYTRRLSKTRVAQAFLSKELDSMKKNAVTAQIAKEASVRLNQGLIVATQLTQKLWRKKNNKLPEEKLAVAQRDQAIFNRSNRLTHSGRIADPDMTKKSKRKVSTTAADNDFSANPEGQNIISDVVPIIHIGNTSRYTASLTDEENLKVPFKIKKLPWMEIAVIAESTDGHFIVDSKILSINGHPASSMLYTELRHKLGSHHRPMTLVLERPPNELSKRSLDDLVGISDDRLKYSAFKVLLSNELLLIKHSISVTARSVFDAIGLGVVPTHHRKPYMTRLILTETDLYYRRRLDVNKVESDHWIKVPLYSIKFILEGKEIHSIANHGSTVPIINASTGNIEADLKAININLCFSIVTETTEIILELPSRAYSVALLDQERHEKKRILEIAQKDMLLRGMDLNENERTELETHEKDDACSKNHSIAGDTPAAMLAKTKMVISCLKMLVQEVRSSQVYVDKEGVPTLRRVAKKTLRELNR